MWSKWNSCDYNTCRTYDDYGLHNNSGCYNKKSYDHYNLYYNTSNNNKNYDNTFVNNTCNNKTNYYNNLSCYNDNCSSYDYVRGDDNGSSNNNNSNNHWGWLHNQDINNSSFDNTKIFYDYASFKGSKNNEKTKTFTIQAYLFKAIFYLDWISSYKSFEKASEFSSNDEVL